MPLITFGRWMNLKSSLPFTIWGNRYRGAMCVGVTSALYLRVCDHKNERYEGHTKIRGTKSLVWYSHFPTMEDAIHREKLLKKWHRTWKFRIIEELNPNWLDVHDHIDANVSSVKNSVFSWVEVFAG
jgi:putative endonuclease